jgi:plasmid stabilization system protein ParE
MRVHVTLGAGSDLRTIKAFLSDQSVVVAERVLDQIANMIGRLSTFPRPGHPGVVDGTQERIVPRTPYEIVYRIDLGDHDELVILASTMPCRIGQMPTSAAC